MILLLLPIVAGVALPQQPQAQLRTAYDSTMHVVADVGLAVAGVRGHLDHYRTLVFNDSNATGTLMETGTALRGTCDQLTQAATSGHRIICLHCLIASLQPAMNHYRAYLPQLAVFGRRCSAMLSQRTLERAKPVDLRRIVLSLGQLTVQNLRVYEVRVGEVRAALETPDERVRPSASGRPGP